MSLAMMYGPDQLRRLAAAYCAATGNTLSQLGRNAIGNNTIFVRLAQGYGCNARSAEKLSLWLRKNWPEGLAWPLDEDREAAQ